MSDIRIQKLRDERDQLRRLIKDLIKAGDELYAATEILHADDERVWDACKVWTDTVKSAE